MLNGEFNESIESVIHADVPGAVVKCLLEYLYSGRLDSVTLKTFKFELLDLSSCYMLTDLQALTMDFLVQSLSDDTCRDTLTAASLHANTSMKMACFAYIQKRPTDMLPRADIVSIATNDTSLWGELTTAIKGQIPPYVPCSCAHQAPTAGARLFESKQCEDVGFNCLGGEKVLAHKNILAASSISFRDLFVPGQRCDKGKELAGICGNEDSMHFIEISHPAEAVKALLRFLYTGDMSMASLREYAVNYLDISTCYKLVNLQALTMDFLVRSLTDDTCKDTLTSASFHDNTMIKMACFKYIQEHSIAMLTRPDMVSISINDTSLWAELATAIQRQIAPYVKLSELEPT